MVGVPYGAELDSAQRMAVANVTGHAERLVMGLGRSADERTVAELHAITTDPVVYGIALGDLAQRAFDQDGGDGGDRTGGEASGGPGVPARDRTASATEDAPSASPGTPTTAPASSSTGSRIDGWNRTSWMTSAQPRMNDATSRTRVQRPGVAGRSGVTRSLTHSRR
jgi:hypothetical protein